MKHNIVVRSIPSNEAEPWLLFKHYAHHILKLGPSGGVDGGQIVERVIFKYVG